VSGSSELVDWSRPSRRRTNSRQALIPSLLLALSLVRTPEAGALGAAWKAFGPPGGTVFSVLTHPSNALVAYAGAGAAGVFRTSDGGESWAASRNGMAPDILVSDIAVAYSDPSVLFATTYADGVYKSVDGGASWSEVDALGSGTWVALAIDPTDPDTVYASSGVATFKTQDGGTVWQELRDANNGPIWAQELLIPQSEPETIYAAGSGWWRSMDGGETWWENGAMTLNAAALDPENPATAYGGSWNRVIKTTDRGTTWEVVHEFPPLDEAISLSVHPGNPDAVYVGSKDSGVIASSDGGQTWGSYAQNLPAVSTVRSLAISSDGSTLFAGLRHHGIFRRSVGASGWDSRSDGLVGSAVYSVAVAPSEGKIIYAGVEQQGVARSTDGGKTWAWRGLLGTRVTDLAVHPQKPGVAYAAADARIYKTTDGGMSWKKRLTSGDLIHENFMAVVVAPSNGALVYAGTAPSGDYPAGLYRSKDGCATWKKVSGQQAIFSLDVHPQNPEKLLAGAYPATVARSTDGGKTWKKATGFPAYDAAQAIAYAPSNPARAYAALDRFGVLRTSLDGGKTWQPAQPPEGLAAAVALVVSPFRPVLAYAGGFRADGTWRIVSTSDGGLSWEAITQTGMVTTHVSQLAISPSGRSLYAGTFGYGGDTGGGVFRLLL
jgi:xyloglucan-specific exo-beta-1,4-glucanase